MVIYSSILPTCQIADNFIGMAIKLSSINTTVIIFTCGKEIKGDEKIEKQKKADFILYSHFLCFGFDYFYK